MEKIKKIKELFNTALSSDKFWLCFIFCVTFSAFAPSLFFKQLFLDDNFYFLNVLSIQKSFLRIWDPVLKLFTPLTSLSLYIDYLLWGKKGFTVGAHLTNIVLHCGTGVIFYLLLRSFKWGKHALTPSWAGMAVLIFTLHPQRVESVVWISERKDCLAMVLGIGALLLFWRALEKEKISWGSVVCLFLSLLAKPMWLFFFVPAAAMIWMKNRSFQWKLWLKLLFPPLFLFTVFTTWLAWGVISNKGAHCLEDPATLFLRAETVFYNYGNYFIRTFLPGNLFPLYPYYDPETAPRWMALIPVFLLLTPFFMQKKEFRPAILFGVLPLLICFAALLIPVVGFVRVGNTDFADRYSYLPSLFLIAGSAFLLKINISINSAFGAWFPMMGILYCGGLLYETERYLPIWNDFTAFTDRCISVKSPNVNAVLWKVCDLYSKGKYEKALQVTREKFPENPEKPDRFKQVFKLSLKGLILFQQGKPEQGIQYLNAIYMSPYSHFAANFPLEYAQKVFSVGATYHWQKYNDKKAAANLYMRCAVLFKHHAKVYQHFYTGMQALMEENYAKAVEEFRIAHKLNPNAAQCVQNLRYAENKLKEQKK